MRPEIDRDFGAEARRVGGRGLPRSTRARPSRPAPAARALPPRLRESPRCPRLAAAATVLLVADRLGRRAQQISSGVTTTPTTRRARRAATMPAEPPSEVRSAERARRRGATDIGPAPDHRAAGPPPPASSSSPARSARSQRDASMKLSTEPDEVAEVADGVVEVTERYDGIVALLERQHQRRARARDLRPADPRPEPAGDPGRPLGPGERLGAQRGDPRRHGSLHQRRGALRRRQGRGGRADRGARRGGLGRRDRADPRAAPGSRAASSSAARSELAGLKQRTDFSRLAVTVVGDGDADGWSFGDAVDDAGSVLEDLAGATLVALAVIVPLGLIGSGALVRPRRRPPPLARAGARRLATPRRARSRPCGRRRPGRTSRRGSR